MNNKSRTSKSIINMCSALVGQSISIFVAFGTRIVFTRKLGEVYLGVNGLCTSIVGLLSLAELGIGESINYKLYKPLAENDTEQVKSLMRLYRNVYLIIGAVILVIGLLLIPFLDIFFNVSDKKTVDNLVLIFLLFIINSASSYWLSYRRALIISDQKRYIVTIVHYSFYCLMNILQIVFLLMTKDYIAYLLIMIICTLIQNVIIYAISNKLYPYLKEDSVNTLKEEDTREIKRNTIALMYHKIGSTVVNSTDNILVSKMIGIAIVGIYSNYLLVTTALNTIIAQLFSAVTPSVGNLGASESKNKSENVLEKMFFGNFVLVAIICASFFSSINLLIKVFFGEKLILNSGILVCIATNLYIYNIRRTAWTFRDAYGLFWYDRYKAIAEVILNLAISIILGRVIGLQGILLGTIIGSVLTSLWIEPYILYKYGLKASPKRYYMKLLQYSFITVFDSLVCYKVVLAIEMQGILGFIVGVLISTLISGLLVSVIYWKTEEYRYYIRLMRTIANKVFEKLKMRGRKNA